MLTFIKRILIIAAVLCIGLGVSAKFMEEGEREIIAPDDVASLELSKKCNLGSSKSCLKLGNRYLNEGREYAEEEVSELFKRACELENQGCLIVKIEDLKLKYKILGLFF